MPRVVPSQVVSFIDRVFSSVVTQTDSQQNRPALHREHSGLVAALVSLVQQIPQELLVLDDVRYSELVASIAMIQDMIPHWQLRDDALEGDAAFNFLHPI